MTLLVVSKESLRLVKINLEEVAHVDDFEAVEQEHGGEESDGENEEERNFPPPRDHVVWLPRQKELTFCCLNRLKPSH